MPDTFFSRHLKRTRDFFKEELAQWTQDSNSDDTSDEEKEPPKKRMVNRDREAADARLYQDYLSPNPTYDKETFQRRFRMPREMFVDICTKLVQHDKYWEHRRDCTGRLGLSTEQRVTSALRQLAYGLPADATDEYLKLGESTALKALKKFCSAIIHIYGPEFLRPPTKEELETITKEYELRGFPGCKGSIDGMHWSWKNCPSAWAGRYRGKEKSPSIVLEAVASKSCRIWHAYFGAPGSLNDINILNQSPLFDRFLAGTDDNIHFTVNGNEYKHGYYLADGIYPSWPVLVKSIRNPGDDATAYFATRQEAARKDIERTFGILQARWEIIKQPGWLWKMCDIRMIMYCCIVLRNMVVEARLATDPIVSDYESIGRVVPNVRDPRLAPSLTTFINASQELHDSEKHLRLTRDLITAGWLARGGLGNENL